MRFPNPFKRRRGFGAENLRVAERRRLAYLSFLTLGVVFGDIGTSPLYAVSLSLAPLGHPPTPSEVLGVLSLVIWSLILVICFKYQTFVLRADNRGEGGVLALMALLRGRGTRPGLRASSGRCRQTQTRGAGRRLGADTGHFRRLPDLWGWHDYAGYLGAFGGRRSGPDHAKLHPLILPITCIILFLLFWFQRRGTKGVSIIFESADLHLVRGAGGVRCDFRRAVAAYPRCLQPCIRGCFPRAPQDGRFLRARSRVSGRHWR